MRNLKDFYAFTNEAQKALENFYTSIRKEGKNNPPEDIEELLESLNEHIEISIREKLRFSNNQRIDAQMMLEILYSLGDPGDIVSELNYGAGSKTENAANEKFNIKYKYIPVQKVLCRSSRDRWVFGVCGGFAEYFGVSSLLLRFLFVFTGVGILFYILLGLLIPDENQVKNGGTSSGANLIISIVRGGFLFFMCLIYIPLLLAFFTAALTSFTNLIGLHTFLPPPILGATPGFLISGMGFVLSFSLLMLLLNLIMQLHFNGGFLKLGSRNVYAFAAVISLIGISLVFANFKNHNKILGESYERFDFKSSKPSITMVFSEKQSYIPVIEKSIEVVGTNDTDSISIDVVKAAYGPNEDTAREYSKDLSVKIEMAPEDKMLFVISSKDASRSYYNFPKLKFIIKIPEKLACKIEADDFTNNYKWGWFAIHDESDVSVSKINATTEVTVENMNMKAENIESEKLSLVGGNGNVAVDNIKVSDFTVRVSNGNVRAEKVESKKSSIKTSAGNIKAVSINADFLKCISAVGNISLDKAAINNESDIASDAGNIKINYRELKPKSSHKISSDVGNIKLVIPEGNSPKVVTSNSVGNTKNEFENAKSSENSPVLNVKTSVGNIRILKE